MELRLVRSAKQSDFLILQNRKFRKTSKQTLSLLLLLLHRFRLLQMPLLREQSCDTHQHLSRPVLLQKTLLRRMMQSRRGSLTLTLCLCICLTLVPA